jgi:hypothetical protein
VSRTFCGYWTSESSGKLYLPPGLSLLRARTYAAVRTGHSQTRAGKDSLEVLAYVGGDRRPSPPEGCVDHVPTAIAARRLDVACGPRDTGARAVILSLLRRATHRLPTTSRSVRDLDMSPTVRRIFKAVPFWPPLQACTGIGSMFPFYFASTPKE